MNTKKFWTSKNIAKMAILSAIACILMYIEFPLPIAPSFYKIDFSEVAALMGGFAMGPLAGVLIEAFKLILKIALKGSETAFVGEFANFIVGCGLIIPATIIYQRNKNKKSAIVGCLLGTVMMALIGVFANIYILLPFYEMVGFPISQVVALGAKITPLIHDLFSFVILCVLPFNLVKGILVSLVTFLLYKHVSPILHR